MELKEAMAVLRTALLNDEDYRLGWQANIAMAFQDEAARQECKEDRRKLHTISNKAAKNFINILTMEVENEG